MVHDGARHADRSTVITPTNALVRQAREARELLAVAMEANEPLGAVVAWCVMFIPGASATWRRAQENSLVLTSGDDRLAALAGDCALLCEFERRFINQSGDDDDLRRQIQHEQ